MNTAILLEVAEAMKVSIITATRDAATTLPRALASLMAQSHAPVESIVIDGASRDNTLAVLDSFRGRVTHLISEPDQGVWDAMNKGVALADGEVVGFLNADDWYADDQVLARVVACFERLPVAVVLGGVVLHDATGKPVRAYPGQGFTPARLAWGLMPPHPACFVRRRVFEAVGPFRTDYRIAADYEWMVRVFVTHRAAFHTLPEVLVNMRAGGLSNRGWSSAATITREMLRACREHGVATNPAKILARLPYKYLTQVLGV